MRVQVPDRNTYIDFPDGTTPDEIKSTIEANWDNLSKPSKSWGVEDTARSVGATLVGFASMPVAGVAGLSRLITTGSLDEANKTVEEISAVPQKLLKTDRQKEVTQNVGNVLSYPVRKSGEGWSGIAELVSTGDLEKATDVIKGTSAGSNFLVPTAKIFGEAVALRASLGVKTEVIKLVDMVKRIKDPIQRQAFVADIAKEAKETGKTPEEIITEKLPQEEPTSLQEIMKKTEGLEGKGILEEKQPSDLTVEAKIEGGQGNTITINENSVLPNFWEDVRKSGQWIDQATKAVDIAAEFDNGKSFAEAILQPKGDPTGNWNKLGFKSAVDFYDQMKRTGELKKARDRIPAGEEFTKESDSTLYGGIPGTRTAYNAIAEPVSRIMDSFKKLFNPTGRGESALRTGEQMSAKRAEIDRYHAQLDTDFSNAESNFNKMTPQEQYDFASRLSTGKGQVTPELQKVADQLESVFQDRVKEVQKVNPDALQDLRENYFPGIWKEKVNNAMGQASSNRPFMPKTFMRHKVFDDFMDAINAGYEPVSNNPITLAKLKVAEIDKYILAKNTYNEGLKTGDITFVKTGEKPSPGYTEIKDTSAIVKYPVKNADGKITGWSESGKYYATDQAAQVINNYLSQPLSSNQYFGDIYRGWMGVSNVLNQAQLIGPFHGGFVAGEAMASKTALAYKQLFRTVFHGDSPTPFLKSMVEIPAAVVTKWQRGNKMEREYLKPGSQPPDVQQSVNDYVSGGMRFKMDKFLRTNQTEAMKTDWAQGNYPKAVLRSPIAFTELMMKPIMDMYVPKVKAGAFDELMQEYRRINPNATGEELRSTARQIGNRIDARLGQVVYDKYFMNNAAKNIIQATVRAPGWSGGTITELGGIPKDIAKFFLEWKRGGKLPSELPDRVAYGLGLATIHATLNGLLTTLLTGEKPTGTDFWAFRTGVTDMNGDPERQMLPTYGKDVYAYKQDPTRTLLHKTHPTIGLISDIARNKDYYGTQIRNPEENLINQGVDVAGYLKKAFTPFFLRGIQNNRERGTDTTRTLLPIVGIMPAPSVMNQTPAERLANEIAQSYQLQKPRTKEEYESAVLRRKYSNIMAEAIKNKTPLSKEIKQEIIDNVKAGKLTDHDFDLIDRRLEGGLPLERSLKRLSLEDAIRVYKKADSQERESIKPIIGIKIDNMESHDPDKLQKLMPKLIDIFRPDIKQQELQ